MDLDLLLLVLISIKNGNSGHRILVDNTLKQLYSSDAEIGYVCTYALENGYIKKEHNEFKITPRGIAKIEEINDSFGRKGIERYIVPYSRYKIKKIDVDDIYIPDKK